MAGGDDVDGVEGEQHRCGVQRSFPENYPNKVNNVPMKDINEYNEDLEHINDLRNAVRLTTGKISQLKKNLNLRSNELELEISLRQFAEHKLNTIQGLNNLNNMKFAEVNNSSFTKRPPVKPPRRKHSMRANSDLKEGVESSISSCSSPANTLDSPPFRSLDAPPTHSQLLATASLPNVKLESGHLCGVKVPHPSVSCSSSDSNANSFRRKENKRHHRRPRRSSSNVSQVTSKSHAKSAGVHPYVAPFFASQWPIALYPMPMGDAPLRLSPQHFPTSSVMFPSNSVVTKNMNNFGQSTPILRNTSSGLTDFGLPRLAESKLRDRRLKRSNSDPIRLNLNEMSHEPTIKSQDHFTASKSSDQDRHDPTFNHIHKNSSSNLRHSSKFAALLEEIYAAQKERDEAMLKRMNNAYKDRDAKIAHFIELQNNRRNYDSDECADNDPETLFSDKINGNLEKIDKAQSPHEIEKHAKQLLQEVRNVKENNKKEVQQLIHLLKAERDALKEKNKRLESEVDHYQTANDTSMDESLMGGRETGDSQDETEMLRICYSLQKSVIQDSQNLSQTNESEMSFAHEAERNDQEVDSLRKELDAEKQAREAAERKCERLEMAVDLLRKKVNKMNSFDGFERRFSSSVDYF